MEVILSKQAKKQYGHLPVTEQKKVKKKLQLLEADPLAGKKLFGELSASRSLRAWPYRIIYAISKKRNTAEVSDIEHRQGVYK